MNFKLLYEKTTAFRKGCLFFIPVFEKLYEFCTGPAGSCMNFKLYECEAMQA